MNMEMVLQLKSDAGKTMRKMGIVYLMKIG